ncbi:MerR family transcriptional regulator [Candidatus Dependentiae bacterium]|nr:MAG: MerR family transcriptional regulator [Candidatus Dependentiae bacterium]
MVKIRRKKGFFSISAVAEMFSVHQQTIRLYEKEGLISPRRSEGNTRLFSEEDINRLEEVIYLTHQLGINLAGVEMIIKLEKQIKKMQKEMNQLFEATQRQLQKESEASTQAVRTSAKQLLKMRGKKGTNKPKTTDPKQEDQIFDIDNWQIEYEDKS